MKTYREKIDLIKSQLENDIPSLPYEVIRNAQIEPPYERGIVRQYSWYRLVFTMTCLVIMVIGGSFFIHHQRANAPVEGNLEDFLMTEEAASFDPLPLVTITSLYHDNRKLYNHFMDDFTNENVQFVHYYLSPLNEFLQISTIESIDSQFGYDFGASYVIPGIQGDVLTYQLYFNRNYVDNLTATVDAKVVYLDQIYGITGQKTVTNDKTEFILSIKIDDNNYVSLSRVNSSGQDMYTYEIVKDELTITKCSIYRRSDNNTVYLLQNKVDDNQSMYEAQLGTQKFIIEYMTLTDRYKGGDPLYGSVAVDSFNDNSNATFGVITVEFDQSMVTYSVVSSNTVIYEDNALLE